MAKERSRVADFLVYLIARVVICIIQLLPFETACLLARGLAWLAYRVNKRHRLAADENLRYAYSEQMSAAERDRTIRAVYLHYCTLLIELIHLTRRLHVTTWKQHAELVGGQRLLSAMLSGRPVLVVTGHFGNWELAGYVLGLVGFKTYAIARTLDNPYVDDLLRSLRERTGQKILAKSGEYEDILGALARGGILATLADQDAGKRGLYVDFFNRPASTHKAVALLALEYNVIMLVVGVPKLENVLIGDHWAGSPARYRITLAEVIDAAEYQDRADAVKALTQRYTSALESVIRLAPEQYFWLHRRWKHQPKGKKGTQAA
jgi:KDO2-lipid IV(A) lauroyltransferase